MTGALLVYGRTEYAEALTERGVASSVEELLRAFTGPWVELIAIPETAVHWIIRDGEDAERELTTRARR